MLRCACSRAEHPRMEGDPRGARPHSSDLITIDSYPFVGETPPMALRSWLTPNKHFYVRNHFAVPPVDPATWSLSVEGEVVEPLRLTLSEILALPKRAIPATLECAGNNRTDLDPLPAGNRFQSGAISTAIWAGVPLRLVLERASVKTTAKEVLFEGADWGEPEPDVPTTSYRRSLPVEAALDPDVLLAYKMNGEPLSEEHGCPLRVVVPGWYGMASVKWLRRIRVLDHEFHGFFQTDRYVIKTDGCEAKPLSRMWVKSIITWPEGGEALSVHEHTVTGFGWSGSGRIVGVEFSADSGKAWRPAQLDDPDNPYAWRPWSFRWTPPAAGHYTLVSRARDEAGNAQPMKSVWNELGYAINGVRPVCVTVR